MHKMNIDPSLRSEQRKFGLLMAVAFAVIAGIRWTWHWYRQGVMPELPLYLLGLAVVFLVLGLLWPGALRPVLSAWMRLALAMNWLVTHAVLTLAFILIFTPIAFARRMLGWDLQKRASRDTFWEPAEDQPDDYESYLNQF